LKSSGEHWHNVIIISTRAVQQRNRPSAPVPPSLCLSVLPQCGETERRKTGVDLVCDGRSYTRSGTRRRPYSARGSHRLGSRQMMYLPEAVPSKTVITALTAATRQLRYVHPSCDILTAMMLTMPRCNAMRCAASCTSAAQAGTTQGFPAFLQRRQCAAKSHVAAPPTCEKRPGPPAALRPSAVLNFHHTLHATNSTSKHPFIVNLAYG
jgi:hypothetical protein